MELILLKDVENVGRKGDIVRVRDGFARNFLLPRQYAHSATVAGKVFVEDQKKRNEKRQEKEKGAFQELASSMSGAKVVIAAQAGEQDKLFGSVTAEDICNALNQQGYSLNRRQIHLKETLRSLGTFQVSVELYPQIKTSVSVEVVRKA